MNMKRLNVCVLLVWFFLSGTAFPGEEYSKEQFRRELTPIYSKGPAGIDQPRASLLRLPFRKGSYQLTPEAIRILNTLGETLREAPLNQYRYRIEGHTRDLGGKEFNLDLSRKRATTVSQYMTSKFGFPKEMFEIEGFGLTRPIAPNNVEDSRAKNRRIEIINTLQPLLVSTPALSKPLLEAKAKFLRSDREDLLSDDITLTQGDSVSIEFTPTRVVYAYVFWIDSTGSKALFPNKEFLKEENPLQPGKLYRIPKFGSWLKLDENKGRETIVIFAQETPLSNPDEVLSRLFRSSEGVRYADASSSKGPGGIRTPPAKQQSAALETSKAETAAKPSETADIDMSHIFSWKLSFHHE